MSNSKLRSLLSFSLYSRRQISLSSLYSPKKPSRLTLLLPSEHQVIFFRRPVAIHSPSWVRKLNLFKRIAHIQAGRKRKKRVRCSSPHPKKTSFLRGTQKGEETSRPNRKSRFLPKWGAAGTERDGWRRKNNSLWRLCSSMERIGKRCLSLSGLETKVLAISMVKNSLRISKRIRTRLSQTSFRSLKLEYVLGVSRHQKPQKSRLRKIHGTMKRLSQEISAVMTW